MDGRRSSLCVGITQSAVTKAAGSDSVIVMGNRHMHDVRRHTIGTLPIKVIVRTDSSFLISQAATEPDPEMSDETFTCE